MEEKILKILTKYNIFDSKIHMQLSSEIKELGLETVIKLARDYSPSQLGRMNLLGTRKLAQIRRDNPELFKKIVEELLSNIF